MMRGTMLWFNEEKDHGVITTDDGERVAVHRSGFADSAPEGPCAGLVVEFQLAEDEDGMRAEGVRMIPEPDQRRARRRRR